VDVLICGFSSLHPSRAPATRPPADGGSVASIRADAQALSWRAAVG